MTADGGGKSTKQKFDVGKLAQTITVDTAAPGTAVYNTTFNVAAHASSGLAVTITGSGSCSGTGTSTGIASPVTITMTSGTGTCTVTYSQAGNTTYDPAPNVTNSTTAQKATATVVLSNLTPTYTGSPLTPTATTTPPGLTIVWTGAPQTDAGTYAVTATVNDTNYQGSASGSFVIGQASSATTISCTAGPFTYTGSAQTPCSATATGAGGLSTPVAVTYGNNTNAGTYATDPWTFTNANYNDASGTVSDSIAKKSVTASVTASNKPYDGNTTATITACSLSGVVGLDVVTCSAGSASFADANVGTGKTVTAITITLGGAAAGNHQLSSTTATTTADINPIPTHTAVVNNPTTVQYSDPVQLTATVTADSTAGGALTGTVQFKVGGGTCGVDSTCGSASVNTAGIATILLNVINPAAPTPYAVTATFSSSNTKYGNSSGSTDSLKVNPEAANPVSNELGAYTGQKYAWTPTATSNTATVTLGATILDSSDPYPGNITRAKVTFGIRSGSTITPISGAQNLPVGLVDPLVPTKGTAQAIMQVNLNSNDTCTTAYIVVMVGGDYNMPTPPWWDTHVTVCRATPGTILSMPDAQMSGTNAGGYLAGSSSVHFDVKYNKSGTNPQGKVTIRIKSNRNSSGIVDGLSHEYEVASNAIAVLNVNLSTGTADFSAKATVNELVMDAVGNVISTVNLDGGAIIQLSLVNGSPDQVGITINMSKNKGGVWFSSSWDGTKTLNQPVLNPTTDGGPVYLS